MKKRGPLRDQPRVTPSEWKVMVAATRAWSIRELARISGLPVSTVHRTLGKLAEKVKICPLFDFRRINLLPVFIIFPRLDIKKAPPFTFSIRDIYNIGGAYTLVGGLVPVPYVDRYVESFEEEPLLVVRGYEWLRWHPEGGLSEYLSDEECVSPVFDFGSARKMYDYPLEVWSGDLSAPDIYDLILIQGRMHNAFARPLKVYRAARKMHPHLPEVSEQVLSYHFNRHVKSLWRGNALILLMAVQRVPVRVFYFKGRDAPVFARLLSQLPGAFSATIDVDEALVVGQFPCSYDENVMREAASFDLEMPYGYFVQSSSDLKCARPCFWLWVEEGKWVFNEEMRVPIVKVQVDLPSESSADPPHRRKT